MTEPVAKILAQEFSSPKKLEAKLVELAQKPVTDWDKLMTGLGYEPLKNFYLK